MLAEAASPVRETDLVIGSTSHARDGATVRRASVNSASVLGAVEVLVPRDRAEEARDLLTRVDHGEFMLAADDRSGGP